MSDHSSVHELDRGIKTMQCRNTGTLHLETGDLDHHEDAAPVQVSLRQSRDTVALSIGRGVPGEDITADTTLFVSPPAARDLATAMREPAQIDFTQSKATMWLRMEWLHHDGPQRRADSFYGAMEFADGWLSMAIHGDGDGDNGRLRLAAALDDDERAWVADHIEEIATQAADYDPPTTPAGTEGPASNRSQLVAGAIGLGIATTVGVIVYNAVVTKLAGETVTFARSDPGMAAPVVLVIGCALLIAAALGMVPGIPAVPRMGGRL